MTLWRCERCDATCCCLPLLQIYHQCKELSGVSRVTEQAALMHITNRDIHNRFDVTIVVIQTNGRDSALRTIGGEASKDAPRYFKVARADSTTVPKSFNGLEVNCNKGNLASFSRGRHAPSHPLAHSATRESPKAER